MNNTFDENIAKYADHNAAYDSTTNELHMGPTSRVLIGESWHVSTNVHKWAVESGPRKGNYLSVLDLGEDNSVDHDTARLRLQAFQDAFDKDNNICTKIEDGIIADNVYVYKFSVNVWRSVTRKGTKWVYNDIKKPTKEEPCVVQRLLVE